MKKKYTTFPLPVITRNNTRQERQPEYFGLLVLTVFTPDSSSSAQQPIEQICLFSFTFFLDYQTIPNNWQYQFHKSIQTKPSDVSLPPSAIISNFTHWRHWAEFSPKIAIEHSMMATSRNNGLDLLCASGQQDSWC